MALQFSFDSQFDINFPTAYARVISFNGDKLQVNFSVAIYKDQQARESSKQPLLFSRHTVAYIDGMAISSLYDYLKTLPEFTGAVDV